MKKLLGVLTVILLLIQPAVAQESNLDIYITGISVVDDSHLRKQSVILLEADLTIINNAGHPVEFTHRNLCEFVLRITPHTESAENYYPFACAEALKIVEFPPGSTGAIATGGVLVNDGSRLPDGNYTVELDLVEYQLKPVNMIYNASFGVVNNTIADFYATEPAGLSATTIDQILIYPGIIGVLAVIPLAKLISRGEH